MDWILVTWIIVNSGSMTSNKVAEHQCRSYVEFLNSQPGVLIEAICIDPAGARIHSMPIAARQKAARDRAAQESKPKVEM